MPSVASRSWAIGVSKLTGMNSAAISSATHIVMAPTAPQFGAVEGEELMVAKT